MLRPGMLTQSTAEALLPTLIACGLAALYIFHLKMTHSRNCSQMLAILGPSGCGKSTLLNGRKTSSLLQNDREGAEQYTALLAFA